MAEFKVGDRVRVKGRDGWPADPGFVLTNAEGTVVKWVNYDDVMEEFQDYFHVLLEKADGKGQVYIGNTFVFRIENLERIGRQ
jgi:hypothetical protein